jgi:CheY-like chemotaxis protein
MKKIKVLVIEDERMLQDAYKHVLSFKGYTVLIAADGIEGLRLLDKHKPDIVLLDVLMPRLDGMGFLEQANIKQRFPETKVIACSNLSDQKTTDFMYAHGADEVVLKSDLSPSQLIDLIDGLTPKK